MAGDVFSTDHSRLSFLQVWNFCAWPELCNWLEWSANPRRIQIIKALALKLQRKSLLCTENIKPTRVGRWKDPFCVEKGICGSGMNVSDLESKAQNTMSCGRPRGSRSRTPHQCPFEWNSGWKRRHLGIYNSWSWDPPAWGQASNVGYANCHKSRSVHNCQVQIRKPDPMQAEKN